jgi:hypothetical protein
VSRDRSLDEFLGDESGTDENSDADETAGENSETAPTEDSGETARAEDSEETARAEDSEETAPEAAPEATPAGEDSTPAPAPVTYDWSPGGRTCAACGASVQRRWRAGERDEEGRLVCVECKSW